MSLDRADALFDLDRVSFSYDNEGSYALYDVSLKIRRGATTAVLGLSGSGKTTLLNLLGLLSDGAGYKGNIKYCSADFGGGPLETAAVRRRDFGFVLQSAYMLPHFTCWQNVGMPLALQKLDGGEVEQRALEILQTADPRGRLLHLKDSLARDVSGGERQRMAVLRAVIHDPQVVFADEPLASLDPRNAEHILQLLQNWKAGDLHRTEDAMPASDLPPRSLILVTHDIDVAWETADEFIILVDGRTVQNRVWRKAELQGPDEIKSLMTPQQHSPPPVETESTRRYPGLANLLIGWCPALIAQCIRFSRGQTLRGAGRLLWSALQGLAACPIWLIVGCWRDLASLLGWLMRRSTWRGFCFCGWFAGRNLGERHAWRSTFINAVSIAAVLVLVILTFGATWGVEETRLQELRDDPLNLCLWVGSSIAEPQFDKATVAHLTGRISSKLSPNRFLGCFPFSETDFYWYDKDGGGRGAVSPFYGRTIRPEDPMLRSLKLAGGNRAFLGANEEGVIVTRGMLDALGYLDEELPAAIMLEPRSGGGGRLEVAVLDVVLADLPLSHDFVIPERYESKLLHANLNPTLLEVSVGPIPDNWPSTADLPPTVKEMFRDYYNLFEPLVESRSEGKFWKLTHNGNGPTPTLSDWRFYLKEINVEMKRQGYKDWPEIANFKAPAQDIELPVRTKHDFAGIYLSRLDGLTPAAEICEAEGLNPDKDVVTRLLAIGGQTKAILRRLAGFAFLIGGIVLFYMSLVQFQRNEQKTAEIGMLKAIGMTPKGLLTVALAEATLLWLLGVCLGGMLLPLLGPLAAIEQTASGAEARVVYSWKLIAATVAISYTMCVVSNLCATWRSRRRSASESLRAA